MTADFGESYSPDFLFLSHLSILQLVRQTTFISKSFIFFSKYHPSWLYQHSSLSKFPCRTKNLQQVEESSVLFPTTFLVHLPRFIFDTSRDRYHQDRLWYIKRWVLSGQTFGFSCNLKSQGFLIKSLNRSPFKFILYGTERMAGSKKWGANV